MKAKIHVSVAGASLLLVAAGLAASSTGLFSQGTPVPPNHPPEEFWGVRRTVADDIHNGYQHGVISWDTKNRHTVIDWSANPYGPGDFPDFDDNVTWNTDVQTFATRFFTTDVVAIGGAGMVVGGLTSRGDTLMEYWTLDWPTTMPSLVTDPSTGRVSVEVTKPRRSSVTELYFGNEQGKEIVRHLMPRHSSGNVVHGFVQFNDSRDLYSFEVPSGNLKFVTGPTAGNGPLPPIPELANDYETVWSAKHIVHGHIHVFRSGGNAALADPVLVLADQDLDGILDAHFVIVAADWLASEFAAAGQYEQESLTGNY